MFSLGALRVSKLLSNEDLKQLNESLKIVIYLLFLKMQSLYFKSEGIGLTKKSAEISFIFCKYTYTHTYTHYIYIFNLNIDILGFKNMLSIYILDGY